LVRVVWRMADSLSFALALVHCVPAAWLIAVAHGVSASKALSLSWDYL